MIIMFILELYHHRENHQRLFLRWLKYEISLSKFLCFLPKSVECDGTLVTIGNKTNDWEAGLTSCSWRVLVRGKWWVWWVRVHTAHYWYRRSLSPNWFNNLVVITHRSTTDLWAPSALPISLFQDPQSCQNLDFRFAWLTTRSYNILLLPYGNWNFLWISGCWWTIYSLTLSWAIHNWLDWIFQYMDDWLQKSSASPARI